MDRLSSLLSETMPEPEVLSFLENGIGQLHAEFMGSEATVFCLFNR